MLKLPPQRGKGNVKEEVRFYGKKSATYITHKSKTEKNEVEWKWAVYHKELLHYKGACPWKKETKSYGRYSFQVPVYCQNYWRSGMNEKHNEWNLSHLLSLTVCKFLVNRRLSADAGVNDVFSVLSALVALSLARSLLRFIISITEKWASYEDGVGLWKKKGWDMGYLDKITLADG